MRSWILALFSLNLVMAAPALARHHHPSPQPQPQPTLPAPAAPAGPTAPGETSAPECLNHGAPLAINNDQVIQWKTSTANQYLARAHIQGTVTESYPDEHGHEHFGVRIGDGAQGTIEVVYNIDFGATPQPTPGMSVEACGDFINSFAPAGPYPTSPDGAIIHWVHRNPSGHGHDSGFLILNGELYGQGNGHSGG